DKHVDHFRPKNSLSKEDSPNHPGYWWLAFCLANYRYSCTFCNSRRTDSASGSAGGKGDRFPIRDEAKRCQSQTDPLIREEPALLDPTVPGDPLLLWFDQDGTARATYSEQ